MAQQGRTNPPNQRTVVLALECPRLQEFVRPSRQPSVARARAPVFPSADQVANIFSPCILTIHVGEDIGETIRAIFEEKKHDMQSKSDGIPLEGRIFSVSGDVSNPMIKVQGTNTLYEGTYSIATLEGRYIISSNGPVQQDHLKLCFQPADWVVGGSVVGPLIAACEVQVTIGFVRLDD